ncbi:MAG: histidine kinase, partial [Ruminiclostridium sp.]|nr:histidine kinase [Ruminiclostridium sp.]
MTNTVFEQTMTALNVALFVQLFGMIFALVMDPFINKRSKRIMMINTVLVLTLVIQQQAGAYFDDNNMIAAMIVSGIYGYSIRPVIISLFIKIFTKSRKMWILVGLNAAVYCTAFFSELSFYYSDEGNFMRGPLGYSCFVVSVILLIQLIFASVRNYRKTMNRLSVFPFVVVILITAATITDIFILKTYRIDLLTVVSASSCVLYYIWLHLQFVREHENDLKAEQRIRIMMSQMSPHFLFNTLAAIQSLCRTDPVLAGETVQKFGVYLRQNIDTLRSDMLIPFEKELEYTKVYADIEMLQYPNVRLEYDIRDKDFSIPSLTVQPMVENAISHGVRIREKGIVSV